MKQIINILQKNRPEADYAKSTDYLVDGLLDSFDIVALVSDIESHFNVAIPGTAIIPENFRSAEVILKMVNQYIKK